ncbi:MAG: sigma-70 family RNA polymerase sigma factor [Bacteroides sp.]|nr:sigma-70 family RNA polymerase sigma factor [Bacteroides sp.]
MELVAEDILNKLKEGNNEAFNQVFLCYYNRVKKFIHGFIKSEEDARELTQDVFTRIWINRETLDINKSFNAYLFTITRNATYNYLKHQLVHEAYVDDYIAIAQEAGNNVEELFFAREIGLLIAMAVERMPPPQTYIYI